MRSDLGDRGRADFVECMKTGKRPQGDIGIGHRSTNISLLGTLSLELGRSVQWEADKETIIRNPEANKLLSREYRAPCQYSQA